MALASTTIWETRSATGSDTLNGGGFDPGQTAGMLTDGAATVATSASPVFTSASYNFVAGDVNAYLYIASGTNWTPGWYKIASVAANAATLTGACATTTSPTGATWTIDYSQQAAAQFAYTDIASVGTGLTATSAGFPFAKQQVGNSVVVTGGTNLNTGRYVLASVSGVTGTFVGPTNITTGAGLNGTGGMGGALATPQTAPAVTGNVGYWVGSISSASTLTISSGSGLIGYTTTRGDGGLASFTLTSAQSNAVNISASSFTIENVDISAANNSSNAILNTVTQCLAVNCKMHGTNSSSSTTGVRVCNLVSCEVYNCSGPMYQSVGVFNCDIHNVGGGSGSGPMFLVGNLFRDITTSYASTATDGSFIVGNTFYNCKYAFGGSSSPRLTFQNNLFHTITTSVVTSVGANFNAIVGKNFYYNCTALGFTDIFAKLVSCSADPLANAAGGNFALNSVAGGGALVRALGAFNSWIGAGSTTGYADGGAVQHQDVPGRFGLVTGGRL